MKIKKILTKNISAEEYYHKLSKVVLRTMVHSDYYYEGKYFAAEYIADSFATMWNEAEAENVLRISHNVSKAKETFRELVGVRKEKEVEEIAFWTVHEDVIEIIEGVEKAILNCGDSKQVSNLEKIIS